MSFDEREWSQVCGRAGEFAASVDEAGRFPTEAMEAIRFSGALGSALPVDLGGWGEGLAHTARRCALLARACGSTAMIYAMHQAQAATLASYAGSSDWTGEFLKDVDRRAKGTPLWG